MAFSARLVGRRKRHVLPDDPTTACGD